jgi:hypothetical protein
MQFVYNFILSARIEFAGSKRAMIVTLLSESLTLKQH